MRREFLLLAVFFATAFLPATGFCECLDPAGGSSCRLAAADDKNGPGAAEQPAPAGGERKKPAKTPPPRTWIAGWAVAAGAILMLVMWLVLRRPREHGTM